MREFVNRTSDVAETAFSSALSALQLATYFGFSYIALSVATSFITQLLPGSLEVRTSLEK